MANSRFVGAWKLVSLESRQPDGTISRPWGDDPLGMVCWDASGCFSAQLGPRVARQEAPYVAYFGTLEAPDAESGTLVHTVLGSSNPSRLSGEQVRDFQFLDGETLVLRPPQAENGARSSLIWRKVTR